MAREIQTRPQVDIICNLGFGNDPPFMTVDNEPFVASLTEADAPTIAVMPPVGGAPEPEVHVVLCNGEGSGYRIEAWTLLANNTYEAWEHQGPSYCVRSFPTDETTHQIHIALIPADTPPMPDPPDPGTTSTVFKVKVRRKGSMPLNLTGS